MAQILLTHDPVSRSREEWVFADDPQSRESAAAKLVELEWSVPAGVEVVLLSADSLDSLKVSHARYFHTIDELTREIKVRPDRPHTRPRGLRRWIARRTVPARP